MTDPRATVFERRDGYKEASLVWPDLEQATGWKCPGCGETTTVFYGIGPAFEHGKYVKGTDDRVCRSCWEQAQA